MSEFRSHVVVPGSEKRALSQVGSPVPGHELVDVTLVLRRSATGAASASDVDTVVRVMTNAGLEVLQVDASTRRVRVRGEITVVQEVFRPRCMKPWWMVNGCVLEVVRCMCRVN